MSSQLVDGVPLPLPVAGHPALDFCNTRAGWGSPTPKEYLRSPHALALWCREAGLITAVEAGRAVEVGVVEAGREVNAGRAMDAGRAVEARRVVTAGHALVPGDAGAAALQRALALRDALYRISLGGLLATDWALVSAEAAAAQAVSTLVPGTPATWQLSHARPPELPLLAVAVAAADFLTGPRAGTVSACPGVGCGWLFSDPRARRRWCSMAVCGNRAKARRYRISTPEVHGPTA